MTDLSPAMTDITEFTFTSEGATIYGFRAAADAATRLDASAILCHGLTNHHEDAPMFGLLSRRLVEAGVDVYMFDFFGSGRSDGIFRDKTWSTMRQNLADALDAIEATFSLPPGRTALVGRSVGASIVANFLKDPRIGCSVLASPVVLLRMQFEPYRSPAENGYVRMPESVERSGQIKGDWILTEQFFDELEQAERDIIAAATGAERVLVMHCDGDPKVKTKHSTTLLELLGEPKRYLSVADGDHYYTGHEEQAAEATVSWVIEQLDAAVR